MDEFLILLQAKLDEAKSKGNVNTDIDKIQSQLDKLKVQVELDPKAAQKLADSIGKLINQKIVISNIGIDTKSATKAGQEYGKQFSQGVSQELKSNSLKLDTFKKSLANIGMGSKEIDAVANRISNLGVQIETLNQARSSGKKDILSVNIAGIDEYGQAIKLTQQYNIATGKLVNAIDAVSTAQQNVGNNTNSIKKAESVFADYTAKIEQFKSTNSNILSGLLDPLSDFESKLSGLKNCAASIDDVVNSYKNLNAEASKITSNLSAQFNKVDSAVRNIARGDETIASLKADFKGLSNAPKEVNSELTKCEKLLLNVKNIESQEGRTANWSAAYKEWEQSLDSLKAKISTLKKEQSNVASTQIFNTKDLDSQGKIYIQKVNNTIEKTKSELESKLRNAGYMDIQVKGIEDAAGKIKSLTATVTDATGAIKQLNFERAKIQGNGKAQAGFIQTDDVKVIGNISSAVDKVQNSLSLLKTKWEEQGVLVGEFKTKVDQLEVSLTSVGSKGELNGLKAQIQELKSEASTLSRINEIQLSMGNGTYESKVDALVAKTQQWTDVNGNARISTNELSKAFDQLTTASNNYANSPTEAHQKVLIASEKELDKQIKTVTNSVRSMNAELAKDSAISSLHNQLADFMGKNGKTVKYFGNDLRDIFNQTGQGAKLTNQELAVLKQRFIDIQNTARNTGKLGKTWFQTLREGMSFFSYWTSSTFLVMKAIQEIKKALNFTRELDSALVNINYTMDVTSSQLKNIGNKSIEMAKDLHTSAENVLGAVKLYANAKETADSILAKAQPAIMLSNVTGFSGEESAKYLQTIMNQFDLTQDDLMDISDTIQGISQSMAHDFSDGIVQINEGIATSGEVARAAGMDLSEYASMIGMLVEKTGLAGSQLGNSLKTIITRTTKAGKIMGIDEGEISAAETSLRSIGVEVRKTDGEFNAFNDTMSELAKQWDSLSDVEKSNISFNLAGTRQINVIQTLLRNWEEYEELVNKANNSTGVTFENQEKYAASLEGRIKELSATTTSIGENIFKSDDLSVIVSGLTKIAGLFDTITSKTKLLGSIGLGAGLFAGLKNVGGDKMYSLICYLF